jgi:hypothetical protein
VEDAGRNGRGRPAPRQTRRPPPDDDADDADGDRLPWGDAGAGSPWGDAFAGGACAPWDASPTLDAGPRSPEARRERGPRAQGVAASWAAPGKPPCGFDSAQGRGPPQPDQLVPGPGRSRGGGECDASSSPRRGQQQQQEQQMGRPTQHNQQQQGERQRERPRPAAAAASAAVALSDLEELGVVGSGSGGVVKKVARPGAARGARAPSGAGPAGRRRPGPGAGPGDAQSRRPPPSRRARFLCGSGACPAPHRRRPRRAGAPQVRHRPTGEALVLKVIRFDAANEALRKQARAARCGRGVWARARGEREGGR